MKAKERLQQIKEDKQKNVTIQKFVSLTNPKNIALMEALVAWTCSKVDFDEQAEVDQNATIDDLWMLSNISVKNFSDTAGINVTQGVAKLKQLRNLSLIFPDGTALSKAISIIKVYVKGKIEDL